MAKKNSGAKEERTEARREIQKGLVEYSNSTSTMETFHQNEILPLFAELGIKVKK